MTEIAHPREEQTLVLIKPDGVKRGLTGEVIHRIERRGLKVVALEMVWATREQMDDHYPKDDAWMTRIGEKTKSTYDKYALDMQTELGTTDLLAVGKMVRGWLLDFIVSGPIVKMVVQGTHAIDSIRKLTGSTIPATADMGTIRGDYSVDSPSAANKDKRAIHNLVHASETPEEAANEISRWFTPDQIHSYARTEEELMN